MHHQLTLSPRPSVLRFRLRNAAAALSSRALGACLALFLSVAPVAGAQQTTGSVRGRVTADDAPNGVASAQVSARNTATGLVRSALSDEQGNYIIRLLPSGTYTVTSRRIGYAPVDVENVRVSVGTTVTADVALRSAAATLAAVRVTERPQTVDVRQGGVQTNVSTEEISNLPTLGRDFTDFINLSGLVSPQEQITTGGQFSIAGQRPSQTNLQIDGVDANNAFFGENRGSSRVPFNFSLESVREFQVVTNGYDVEYGNYSGGVVNIITKGGTNTRRGSVYGNYRGEALTRNDFQGNPPRNFNVQQYSATAEGPFIKDKLFYIFTVDGQRRREPFNPVNLATYNAGGDVVGAAAFERYLAALDTAYGIRNASGYYDNFQTSNDVITLFGRVDWNINERHRLAVRNNFASYNNANETRAATTQGGLSQTEAFKNSSNSLVAELNSAFRNNMSNVLRLQGSIEHRPRIGSELRPGLAVTLTQTGDVARFGDAGVAFSNLLDENKVQLIDNFSFSLGQHELKVGTNNTFTHIFNRFWNGGNGVYTFNSIEEFEAGTPSRYTRTLRADGTAPTAAFNAQEYSAYVQDDWQLTRKLLVQAGLRYDVQRYGDRPGRVVDVERAFGYPTGTAPIDDNNFSPRFALTYDLNGDGRSVARGGLGKFYGRVPFVLGSNVSISDEPVYSLDCSGNFSKGEANAPPAIGDYGNLPSNGSGNPTSCFSNTGTRLTGVPTYTLWNPDFSLPETYKANIGYERLVGEGTRASVDFVYTATNGLYTVRDINLRDPSFTLAGEGGRIVYVPERGFAPNAAATQATRSRNAQFSNVYVNYNDGIARSQAVTTSLDHRFRNRNSVRVTYTWTKAGDNGSYNCCTANEGFTNPRIGVYGPNDVGAIKDFDRGWGPSDFVRTHVAVLSGIYRAPFGVQLSAFWRVQSGTPWGPENGGDLNGDGVAFNDRPFIFAPGDLPVSASGTGLARDSAIASTRARYAGYLNDNACLRKNVGKIIPRNACEQPWRNSLDMSLRKRFDLQERRGVELSVDLFNVLNGLNKDWGRYETVSANRRNLVTPVSYNQVTKQIEYTVPTTFGQKTQVGTNLLLQFSAQVGMRLYF